MNSKQAKALRKEFKSMKKDYKLEETKKQYLAGFDVKLDDKKQPVKDEKGEPVYEPVMKNRVMLINQDKETATYKEAKNFFYSMSGKEKGKITKERKTNGNI